MDFEWDAAKDAANQEKHGIAFARAVAVFTDPFAIDEDGTTPEHGENRRKAVGRVGAEFVTVIYTDRPNARRILSARRARRNERVKYHQGSASG